MGNLRERNCDNCKHLFEAMDSAFCEKTKYRVVYVGDDKKALSCEFFLNKYYEDNQED